MASRGFSCKGETNSSKATVKRKTLMFQDDHKSTYSADFLEIAPVASKVDELLIEEPGELEVQRGVMGHLAGQDNALTHSHIQMTRWTGDHSWFWEHNGTRGQSYKSGWGVHVISHYTHTALSPDWLWLNASHFVVISPIQK